MTPKVRPSNFVAEINGHQIYRRVPDDRGRCDIWTPGTGWWAFGLSEEQARRQAEIIPMAPLKRKKN
jgi:hypothetical protein